jgi:hypothetical protein
VTCYQAIWVPTLARGENQPGYRGEQYLAKPGTARLVQWTPNALSYAVATPTANLLTINQNHFDGWHLVMGHGKVVPGPGLLRVEVPGGVQQISLRLANLIWDWDARSA